MTSSRPSEFLLSFLALAGTSSSSLAEELLQQVATATSSSLLRGRPALVPGRGISRLQQQKLKVRLQGLADAALRLRGGDASSALERVKVPLAFTGWYLMSIVYSCVNKEVLTVWKFPCAFAALQLLVGSMFVGLLWTPIPTFGMSKRRFAPLREPPRLDREQLMTVSTVAVWLALGHLLSTVAPAYGTVAFTNVVKTLEPLFTCIFSATLLKQIFAVPVYLSLIPGARRCAPAARTRASCSFFFLRAPRARC